MVTERANGLTRTRSTVTGRPVSAPTCSTICLLRYQGATTNPRKA